MNQINESLKNWVMIELAGTICILLGMGYIAYTVRDMVELQFQHNMFILAGVVLLISKGTALYQLFKAINKEGGS